MSTCGACGHPGVALNHYGVEPVHSAMGSPHQHRAGLQHTVKHDDELGTTR